MARDNPKPSSSKRPPSSSNSEQQQRRSRWESSSAATAAATSNNPSSDAGKFSKVPARPTSDKHTTKRAPNPNPNPSPAHPNPSSAQAQASGPLPPSLGPPPPPSYGFHMLDRRTIILADGSVRSYFALPPDYQDFPMPPPRESMGRFAPPGGPEFGRFGPMSPNGLRERDDLFGRNRGGQDYWNSIGLEGQGRGPEGSMKRKLAEGEERERDEFARQRLHLLQYGNAGASSSPFGQDDELRHSKHMRIGGGVGGGFDNNVGMRQEVDPGVMKACFHFAKLINDNPNQKRNYLENGSGRLGSVQCLACGRSSKDFPDVHGLIMHTYNSDIADTRVDHLGLHRALCVLMGWSYMRPPDNSRAYQFLPADEAAANQDDLILWPPVVIIHNTNTGKGKDGRMEGLGNKAMDSKLRDLGFSGGKSQTLYNREGHRGITIVKFANDPSGLKEAMRLADYFVRERHGRLDWTRLQSIAVCRDDERNPDIVTVDERTGERTKVLYGYLATAADLEKLDTEIRKKLAVESKREKLQPFK